MQDVYGVTKHKNMIKIISSVKGSWSNSSKNMQRQQGANDRRKVAMAWNKVSCSARYKRAVSFAAKDLSRRVALQMEEELFDGILLNLSGSKASAMSYARQKRLLRRIVEKSLAQQSHRMFGRSADRFSSHLQLQCACDSMKKIRRYQLCA